ncbi:DUF5908 family protein [Parachryseolinea silvisoli]|uniref:DUF5908 family protein n=1 Tax=Parachryseolinea silvisoli TaxID=2873601 RepID=UPI0022659C19|nr:DUF5908 family protein [Parachryseolinea silvisoli]MCD9019676.1 DUF5908 family protein [Parachryseolinea silvisoli]
MPLDVKEFIIQAKFEDEAESPAAVQQQATDYRTMKEEIISDCLEKIEELLRKRDRR